MRFKHHHKSWLWIALGAMAFVAVCLFTPARALFDEEFLITEFKQMGAYAPLFFVLLFTTAVSLGFPGNVMAVAGGAVFGMVLGTLLSLVGSTLGAVGAFWLARYLLHDWVMRHFGHHSMLQRLNRAIAQYPFTFTLAVRFTPLSPFSLVNFLFGLTPIDLKTYTVGTFLGLIPLMIAYSWLGVTGRELLHGGDRIPFFLALGFLTLLSLLPILAKKPAR